MNDSIIYFSGTTIRDITNVIKEAAKGDNVSVIHRVSNLRIPTIDNIWEIEVIYNDYHYVERFNTSMIRREGDINRIALGMLTCLFRDYFHAKLGEEQS